MSLELVLVFALASPPSTSALQSALNRQGIPVRVLPSSDLQIDTGFLQIEYETRKSGFYLNQLSYEELTSDYPQAKTRSRAAKAVLSFGWGADFLECASVFQVASVLVSEFGADAFDTESASYISLKDIRANAAACYDMSKGQKAQH